MPDQCEPGGDTPHGFVLHARASATPPSRGRAARPGLQREALEAAHAQRAAAGPSSRGARVGGLGGDPRGAAAAAAYLKLVSHPDR